MSKIYVGNLSWNTTDDALRQAFSPYGQVLDVRVVSYLAVRKLICRNGCGTCDDVCPIQSIVMRDRDTGRSRGFGFVTYGTPDEANAAISALNDHELDGRRVKVNMANARGGAGGAAGGFGGAPSGFSGGYGGGGYPGGQGYPSAGGYGGFPAQSGGFGGYPGSSQGYQGGGYQGYQQQSGGGYGY